VHRLISAHCCTDSNLFLLTRSDDRARLRALPHQFVGQREQAHGKSEQHGHALSSGSFGLVVVTRRTEPTSTWPQTALRGRLTSRQRCSRSERNGRSRSTLRCCVNLGLPRATRLLRLAISYLTAARQACPHIGELGNHQVETRQLAYALASELTESSALVRWQA
jgi:hypothetical protein